VNIQGKTAIVTGGASGLGAACVAMFRKHGGRAFSIDVAGGADYTADVSSAEAVEAVFAKLEGPLHVCINCAGIGSSPTRVIGKTGPVPLDWFERVIRVNLIGTFNVSRLAAARMAANEPDKDGERGVIINTASIAAFDGQIGQCAYSASKGGIVGLTLPLARDLARHAIRVMTIAPGIFDTPLLAKLPEEARLSLGAAVPNPARLGHPDEFAQLAQQIIENSMLNGEVIRIDGALRMAPK
jgi:NAD(P)-dependent dehydrogenase (short-subunit alcohol dehydrogenase family)